MSMISDDSRKLFYSIGEVAAYFNVNESTLRFWEKEFPKVIKPRKTAKGTRSYTKNDIEDIRLIHFLLKEKGMTIAGARKKIREEKKGMTAQHELANRLKKIKSELLRLQQELGNPLEEAPEFPDFELETGGRFVFAEPGTEMIPVSAPYRLEEEPGALLREDFYEGETQADEQLINRVPDFIEEIPLPEMETGVDHPLISEEEELLAGTLSPKDDFQEEEEDQSWKDEFIQPVLSPDPKAAEEETEVPEPERFFRENSAESDSQDKGWKSELF